MKIVIVTKESTVCLGRKILKKIIGRSRVRQDEVFTLDSGEEFDAAKEIIKQHEIDHFIDLSGVLQLSELKKMNSRKHTFFVGFRDEIDAGETDLFRKGFDLLQKFRCNLAVVRITPAGREGYKYLIIYPEKTYSYLPDEKKFIGQLAEDILKRESTSHSRSIQSGKRAVIPKEIYKEFHSAGRALFEKGLLPAVNAGTYGNLSMLYKGSMYITGRGVDKGDLEIKNICRIDRVDKAEGIPQVFADVHYSGTVKPSIDTAIIHAVYRLTDWQASVHIHTDRIFDGFPLTGYNYPCGTGEELKEIVKALNDDRSADIIQLFKHGLLVMGKSFRDCLNKINGLFEQGVSIREMKESEKEEKEFKEWEDHYQRTNRGKNTDIDIYDLRSLYLVFRGDMKVGILYLRPKNRTLYFVFYSLLEYTKKGLGLGEKIIRIVAGIAERRGYKKIGILTTKECDVYSYYEKRGFRKILEDDLGSIWMEHKIK